ncbi:hypothetical protein KAFR_0A08510 [Kazachstania africana CBS 2517]|uniref:prephenate dehydratase n=1 Tax=Kazachstania africana (strain ATCC 22294 / BCRC 22015 / CBS 2517 / CECT 1963 / NBRC 1671 / NRRL Y-8276) TaxID=1071382 RepID=H2API5_KAZAF|nr:hypothetical protein KAFR_0A08510 [Kazachstania africana CBS 2517]CCF56285.1 hypothetical protein KAFR_0A08510 [Kazachstania africana CBS 2517]
MTSTKTKVLFLGPVGTYSHQAALQQFGDSDDIEYIPAQSIPQCFDDLEGAKDITYSVVPLENSTNGQVVFSYDLLRDRMLDEKCQKKQNQIISSLEVIGEQYVSIAHCLISPVDISGPKNLANYKQVRIHTHPQVWGQVARYLKELRKNFSSTKFELIDCTSTSDAVSQAQQTQLKNISDQDVLNVAIASEAAVHIYKAYIVDHSINDVTGNTTRFLVLQRRGTVELFNTEKMKVSLLTFTTEQDCPGSLVDVLTILKNFSINMCSISSRPFNNKTSTRKWQYIFYIEYDFDGSRDIWDSFYEQINLKCMEWCLWGTFPRNDRYYK